MFFNLFSGTALYHFEEIIQKNIVLIFFLPLLIGSGGNSGSQTATLAIRSLATGDITLKDWGKLFFKEFLVATILGITMALGISLIGYARGGWNIALITFLTMQCIIILSSLVGISLPFIFLLLRWYLNLYKTIILNYENS